MKFLFLSGLGQGGAERQVKELMELLILNNHEVTLATFNKKNIFYNLKSEIKTIELADSRVPNLFRKIYSIFVLRKNIISCKYHFAISSIRK